MEISIEDLKSVGTWLVVICGGFSIIIPAIITFSAQKWSDWKNEKWRLETETKLKRLENELSEKSSILSNLIDIQKLNYASGQERRISAIEKIWSELETLKSFISPDIEFLYNSMTDEEIEELNQEHLTEQNQFFLAELSKRNFKDFYKSLQAFVKKLYLERPFIGEDLWFSLTIYSKFLSRIVYNVDMARVSKNLQHWRKDEPLVKMIGKYLSIQELSSVNNNEFNSYAVICSIFENKLIDEINDVLSGKTASDSSLHHIKIIKEYISDLDTK